MLLSNLQTPRTKLQRSPKFQIPIAALPAVQDGERELSGFGICSLGFLWSLELGIWSFHQRFNGLTT